VTRREPAGWTEPRLADTRFHDVRWFDLVDSTNRYLLQCASEGASEGVVAVADEQTAGRGRMGRAWVAPAGSALLVSVLLRPELPVERMHLVTLAAGRELAIGVAVERELLLVEWLLAYDCRLDALDGVVRDAIARSATLGRRVRVELARETFEGTATSLTDQGFLVVDGRVVSAGDVVHLRYDDSDRD